MSRTSKTGFCLFAMFVCISAVTSITHRRQLVTCLNICAQQVTNCISLRHDRCLRSYHTCLQKARDYYRCFNSSKIKQLIELTRCIEERCPEVEEQIITYENNPLRTQHRKIPFCRPWALRGTNIVRNFVKASEDYYPQCELTICQLVPSSPTGKGSIKKQQKAKPGKTCSNRKINFKQMREAEKKTALLANWLRGKDIQE